MTVNPQVLLSVDVRLVETDPKGGGFRGELVGLERDKIVGLSRDGDEVGAEGTAHGLGVVEGLGLATKVEAFLAGLAEEPFTVFRDFATRFWEEKRKLVQY